VQPILLDSSLEVYFQSFPGTGIAASNRADESGHEACLTYGDPPPAGSWRRMRIYTGGQEK